MQKKKNHQLSLDHVHCTSRDSRSYDWARIGHITRNVTLTRRYVHSKLDCSLDVSLYVNTFKPPDTHDPVPNQQLRL